MATDTAGTEQAHEPRSRRDLLLKAGAAGLLAAPLVAAHADDAFAATADTATVQTWTAAQTFQADVAVNSGANLTVTAGASTGGFQALSGGALTMISGGSPHYVIPAGSPGLTVDPYGNVRMGPNELGPTGANGGWNNTSGDYVHDFLYDAGTRRISARSLSLVEIGDPVDLGLGRFGPNNSYPLGPTGAMTGTTAVSSNDSLGTIYWRGAVPRWGSSGAQLRPQSAAIYTRAAEDFDTVANNVWKVGGHLVFAVTPIAAQATVERMRIRSQGQVLIGRDTPLTSSIATNPLNHGSLHVEEEIRCAGSIYAASGNGGQVAVGALGPSGRPGVAFYLGTGSAPGPLVFYADNAGAGSHISNVTLRGTFDVVGRNGDSAKQVTIGGVGAGGDAGIQFRPTGPYLSSGNDAYIYTAVRLWGNDGLTTRVITSGTTSDANWPAGAPPNGTIAIDGNGIAVRVGGVWKHAALA